MNIKIKQGIDNCYMAHKYEHPGYENDLCAGLRTMNGDGEPCETCKVCYLYYGHPMWDKEVRHAGIRGDSGRDRKITRGSWE